MADIIGSRDIAKSEVFIKPFRQLISKANEKFKSEILSPLTITLGDEFQGVLTSVRSLFELLFFLEEQILEQSLPFRLRYSLALGEIETAINYKVAHDMYGQGLTKAREALERLKESESRYVVKIDENLNEPLDICLLLYQSIISDWKEGDYKVISAYFQKPDYKYLVNKKFYKNRSGAWKKVKSLKLDEYLSIKKLIYLLIRDNKS